MCLAAAFGAACGPPAGALVTRCTAEMMAIGSPSTCEVTAVHLTDEQTASFRFETDWSRVEVVATLQAASGDAVVSIDTLPERTWRLKAGTPLTIVETVRFDRGLKGVMLRVRPADGPLDGLAGTLRYKGLTAP